MRMVSRERKYKTDKNHSFKESFGYALEGLQFALKSERNIRFQLAFAVMAAVLGWFLHLSTIEWVVLLITFALVLLMELINTLIEWTIDLITNHSYHLIAKHVKDVAAGAVLLASTFAIIIGLIIFFPKLYDLFM